MFRATAGRIFHPIDSTEQQHHRHLYANYPALVPPSFVRLRGGQTFQLRLSREENADTVQAFVKAMPTADQRMRFFQAAPNGLEPVVMRPFSHPSPSRFAMLALNREGRLAGAVSFGIEPSSATADIGIMVGQDFKRQGLARELLTFAIKLLHAKAIEKIVVDIAPKNHAMLALLRSFGGRQTFVPDEQQFKVTITIEDAMRTLEQSIR